MKRLALSASLAILIVGGALRMPSLGTVAQDTSEDRLAALETRVAVLETRIALLPTSVTASAIPAPATPAASPRAVTPMAVGSGPGTVRSPVTVESPPPTIEGARTITGWVEGGKGTWFAGEDRDACTLLRVAPGASVEITDQTRVVLATTHLDPGVIVGAWCQLPFQVVVPDASIYLVAITGIGVSTVTRGDLEASGWHLVFSV